MINLEKTPKFYATKWFMWVTLILFPPVGVVCMLKYKRFPFITRTILAGSFLIFLIGMITYVNSPAYAKDQQVQALAKVQANEKQKVIDDVAKAQAAKESAEKAQAQVLAQAQEVKDKAKTAAAAKQKAVDDAAQLAKEKAQKVTDDANAKLVAAAKVKMDAKVAAQTAYSNWVKAQFSTWDGSNTDPVDLVKKNLNDDTSFSHVDTNYTDKGTYLIIKMTYRAKNAFGALILQNVTAKADYKTNTISIISQND